MTKRVTMAHVNGGRAEAVSVLNELLSFGLGVLEAYHIALEGRVEDDEAISAAETLREHLGRRLAETRLWVLAFGGTPAEHAPEHPRWITLRETLGRSHGRLETLGLLDALNEAFERILADAIRRTKRHPLVRTLRRHLREARSQRRSLQVELARLRAVEERLD